MISQDYRLKEPPEQPKMYLGTDIFKYELDGEPTNSGYWTMSADSHIKKALDVVKQKMKENCVRFEPSNNTSEHPFSSQSYRPELDTTEECNEDQVEFYQSLIGML